MGYVYNRGLESLVKFRKLSSHGNSELGVQVGQGFIEQKHLWIPDNGSTKGYPLALTAGQLPRFAVKQLVDTKKISCLSDGPLDFNFGDLAHFQTETHIVINRHLGIQRVILKNHGDIAIPGMNIINKTIPDKHLTRRNHFQAGDQPQGGALSATGRAHQYDEFTICDIQRKIVYCGCFAKGFIHIF